VPPLAAALTAIYIPSFFTSFQDTAEYKIISDELDIVVRETIERDPSTLWRSSTCRRRYNTKRGNQRY
jgi:hypothetical protein